MLQGMACGVIPVTSKVSECIDHIKHNGNGFFIEEIQEYALIDIFYLLEKQEDKIVNSMSLKVTEYAQEFFYIRNVVKSYVCLYGELISRRYI
jgi:glycosyltransferase involved in cell wall biosynthesis